MSKMFQIDGKVMKTWNPFTGCGFNCCYCWARDLALGKLKDTPRYRENGFRPACHPEELKKKFKPGEFIFVSDMGDIAYCPISFMRQVVEVIVQFPDTNFLLQSKAPGQFNTRGVIPDNVFLSTTIETNRTYDRNYISMAPSTHDRLQAMRDNSHPHKMVSIEPVMDFELNVFTSWIVDINPEIVQIGADNYHHNLPEPSGDKVRALISNLESAGIKVEQKDGLHRLIGSKANEHSSI